MKRPRLTAVGRTLCLGGAAVGALGLLGWTAGVPFLLTIVPGHPPIMPNAALGLLLAGVAGALRSRRQAGTARKVLSLLAAAFPLVIGVGTLAEYALYVDLGIDQLFFGSQAGPYPGRASPPTALALAFLGAAIALFDTRPDARARPPELLALGAALIAFVAILGQLFGANALYRIARSPVVGVAVPASIGVLLTALGLLFERPRAGVMRVATARGPGSSQLRHLAPLAVLGAVTFAFVCTRLAAVADSGDLPVVFAILAGATTVISLALLSITAVPLNRVHDALESSRARTLALIEQASDGIFLADLEGRYIDVNRAGRRMLGYTRKALLEKNIADLLRPEDSDRFEHHRARLLEGKTEVGEWLIRHADGHYFPVEVSTKILPDGRWQASLRDISERKRAEAQLLQSEERLDLALRGADLASWDWNVQTGESVLNARAARLLGFRPEELDPHVDSWSTAVHPEDWPGVQRALDDHFRNLTPEFESEHRIRTKSGKWIWILDRGRVFDRDAQGRPLRMVGTALDITERKRAEAEQKFLAEVGSELASTLDYEDIVVRVARLATDGLCDLCIVGVAGEDGEIECLKAVSRETSQAWMCDLLERILLDRQRTQLVEPALALERPLLVQESSPEFVAWTARHAEQLRPLRSVATRSVVLVPLKTNGKRRGALALVSTTPDRVFGAADVRIAEQLASRAALSIENARLYGVAQRAIRMRDDVLGVVAHDLRSPLGSMLMQAELLRNPGTDSERRARKAAEIIDRAATRMNRLIQDLLDVTRIEAGQFSIEPTRLRVGPLITEALDAQRPLAAAAALELEVEVAPDTPEIWADHDRLLQVFENLVGNAIKFTPPGGLIQVGAGSRYGQVLFWVRDTGPGIATEHLPHLFDRFWQARKDGRRGAGLGLPIAKGIVEAHGGRIWVETTAGRGSEFCFTISAGPAAIRAHTAPPPQP